MNTTMEPPDLVDPEIYKQLKKFFPTSCEVKNLLEKLYEETPIVSNSYDDFLKLPVNEEYRKRQQENPNPTEQPPEPSPDAVPEKSCLA